MTTSSRAKKSLTALIAAASLTLTGCSGTESTPVDSRAAVALQASDTAPFEFCAPTRENQLVTFRAMRWNVTEPDLALTIDKISLVNAEGLNLQQAVLVPSLDPLADDGAEFGAGYDFPPKVSPGNNQDWGKRVTAAGATIRSGTGPQSLYVALQRVDGPGMSTGVQVTYHDASGSSFTVEIPATYRLTVPPNDC